MYKWYMSILSSVSTLYRRSAADFEQVLNAPFAEKGITHGHKFIKTDIARRCPHFPYGFLDSHH